MLTDQQHAEWNEKGFLVLPAFLSNGEIDTLLSETEKTWKKRSRKVVVDDIYIQRRSFLKDVRADQANHSFKLNDIYLNSRRVRDLCLHPRVTSVLNHLLGEPAVLCNTLTLARGTQQDAHADFIYMTPRSENKLIATWAALEDVHEAAGPLFYYPGSHLIPPYYFADGTFHAKAEEMAGWQAYYEGEIARRGLKPLSFLAKRGDLFIWHGNLLHGGAPIRDRSRTRQSLVSHFYALSDCKALRMDAVPLNGSYWLRRDPQPVPKSNMSFRTRLFNCEAKWRRKVWRHAKRLLGLGIYAG